MFCEPKPIKLGIISEDKIDKWIVPHLSKGKRGFSTKTSLTKIVLAILKRLKTGCQWRELCLLEYFKAGGNKLAKHLLLFQ